MSGNEPACVGDLAFPLTFLTQANTPLVRLRPSDLKEFALSTTTSNAGPVPDSTAGGTDLLPSAGTSIATGATHDHRNETQLTPADGDEGGEGGEAAIPAPSSPPSAALSSKTAERPRSPRRGDDIYKPAPDTNPVVEAMIEAQLYRGPVGPHEHQLTCPWESEHVDGERATTVYREPTDAKPVGTFKCSATHQQAYGIGNLLNELNVDRATARCKPVIRIIQGEMHRIVAAAERVLAARGGFYRSSGGIVTLKHDHQTGDVTSEQVSEQALALHLSAACDWEKFDGRAEDWRRCDVPSNIVNTLVKSHTCRELPALTGLARQPYLRQGDGALVTTPGYDPTSGIYAEFDPSQFVLPELTRENALRALRRLEGLLREFEFAAPTDKATAICAMLTATVRDHLKVAPGFNISASSSGSGKSYLASVISPFAGPGEARSISYPSTNEEATKVVLSLALEQPSAVCFDDMPTDWLPHGAMNRMMTNGWITERLLGSSKVVTARASSFIMGTGNNIRPLRDMARRIASIYLMPQVETAATRTYAGRPADEIRKNRGRYVTDALTIIGAWRAAGSPHADVPNVAGYEEWSNLCRQSLLWLDLPDPATSLIEQIMHDPDREQLSDLLSAWHHAFGERPTLVRQVLKSLENDQRGDLYDAVMELPCVERGFVNQSKFGRYLGRNKNRIVNGLKLVEAPHSERRAWAVMPVTPQVPLPSPAKEPEDFSSVWQEQKAAHQAARSQQG